ncbi:MAG: hypothetical protein HC933_11530 [Pleurocapsa sp. SU_196_0]|nr:hypothetical protein [Pleurocapsa sp. SU_196_0]
MTDSPKLRQARTLALEAHADQRYGDQPYVVHLERVVSVLEQFGVTPETSSGEALLCAAWLHDSLEDTNLEATRIEAIDHSRWIWYSASRTKTVRLELRRRNARTRKSRRTKKPWR